MDRRGWSLLAAVALVVSVAGPVGAGPVVDGPPIPVGGEPEAVAVSPDGSRVYAVGCPEGVSVINTVTNTVVGSPIPVGIPEQNVCPTAVAVSPDGSRVYVALRSTYSVSVIDTVTNTAVASIPVGVQAQGQSPGGLAVSPDGSRLYVGIAHVGLSVIDTVTNTVVASIPTPGSGWRSHMVVTPDGSRVYVTNQGEGHLSVINTVTNTVVGSPIPVVDGSSYGPVVAMSPDGSRVYVVGNTAEWPTGAGRVSVIDTATNTVVGSPTKLEFFAEGVAVTPDGSRVYVVGYTDERTGAGRMSVIDTATNTVVGSPMKLGDYLERVVVTPDGSRVYVSDRTFEGVWVVAIQPPKAPTRVKAVAGNFAATVSWVRPPLTYKVIDYKVLAYDAAGRSVGKSCTVKAPALSCTVKELKTATNYKFRVQARSAVGTSARSAYSNTVVPKPRVRIALKAVDSGNQLLVDVDPNLAGTRYWSFRVQKKVNGRWVLASRTHYTTQTSKETRTLNLSRGTYRVVVSAKYGYSTTNAPTSVSLRR